MTDDRARSLAVQARWNRAAKTRLNLAVGRLQQTQEAAAAAEMGHQVRTLDRLVREATDLLARWPVPVRDRAGVAS